MSLATQKHSVLLPFAWSLHDNMLLLLAQVLLANLWVQRKLSMPLLRVA